MRHYTKLAATTAVSWALLAPAAFADLTAEQVWNDWKAYFTSLGYTVTADENVAGDRIDVSNIKLEMPNPAAQSTMTMGNISFNGQSDGTVVIEMPEKQKISVESTVDGEESITMNASWSHSGLNFVASGDLEKITYDFKADSTSITLDEVIATDSDVGPDAMAMTMSLSDVSGQTVMTSGDLRTYAQTMTTGEMTYELAFKDPEGEGSFKMNGSSESLNFKGNSAVPPNMVVDGDFAAMMKAGFAFDGVFTLGAGSSVAMIDGPDGPGQFEGKSGGGKLNVSMNAEGIHYGGAVTDYTGDVQVPGFPFPVSIGMSESAFELKMPVMKSDDAKDFKFLVKMQDLSVSDMIWGMVDPAGKLPRDPATLIVDLSGKAKLFVDFIDPNAMEAAAMSDEQPGEVESLNVDQLKLKIAGAEVNGKGALTFDNEDKTTLPGMPKPVGAIDVNIDGANGLLNTLVEMGFVPDDQAMGARMMMGMFTVPSGEGDDKLSSKIEFTEDGRILANGQQLR